MFEASRNFIKQMLSHYDKVFNKLKVLILLTFSNMRIIVYSQINFQHNLYEAMKGWVVEENGFNLDFTPIYFFSVCLFPGARVPPGLF